MSSMDLRLRAYEFLATPAHIWLWCVAKLCGMKFEFYSEGEEEYLSDESSKQD